MQQQWNVSRDARQWEIFISAVGIHLAQFYVRWIRNYLGKTCVIFKHEITGLSWRRHAWYWRTVVWLAVAYLLTDWRWKRGKYDPKYFEILRLFQDRRDCCYSVHQIGKLRLWVG